MREVVSLRITHQQGGERREDGDGGDKTAQTR
jgi:hypothetical protein